MMRPWLLALFLMVIGGAYLVRAQTAEPSTAEPEVPTEAEPVSTSEPQAESTPGSEPEGNPESTPSPSSSVRMCVNILGVMSAAVSSMWLL